MKKLNRTLLLAAAGASLVTSQAQAGYTGPVTLNNEDLIISFRQLGGTTDVNYDLGNISTFLATYSGQGLVSLNSFLAGTSLAGFYGSLNNLGFSASAFDGHVGDANGDSIWTTETRGTLDPLNVTTGAGSTPWTISTKAKQGTVVGHMSTVAGAAFSSTGAGTAAGSFGSTVAEGSGAGNVSYKDLSDSGNNQGKWGGNIFGSTGTGTENVTGSAFTGVVQSDFYSMSTLNPSGTASSWLGYFQFDSSGDLSFYSPMAAVPEPTTYGLLAGFGSLLLAARSRFNKGNA